MRAYCAFCGRLAEDCPGGLWRFGRGQAHSAPAICIYCSRAAVRAFGEKPDATASVIGMAGHRTPGPDSAA